MESAAALKSHWIHRLRTMVKDGSSRVEQSQRKQKLPHQKREHCRQLGPYYHPVGPLLGPWNCSVSEFEIPASLIKWVKWSHVLNVSAKHAYFVTIWPQTPTIQQNLQATYCCELSLLEDLMDSSFLLLCWEVLNLVDIEWVAAYMADYGPVECRNGHMYQVNVP